MLYNKHTKMGNQRPTGEDREVPGQEACEKGHTPMDT